MFDFLDIFLKMIAVIRFFSNHLSVEQVVAVCAVSIVAAVAFVSAMEYRYKYKSEMPLRKR